VGADIGGRTGNSEKFNTGGRIRATLQGPTDRLLIYLRWLYSREDGEKSEDEITGGIDFESDFGDVHSWYARIELENDDIKDLDLRTTAALGYGYYFLKEPSHILRGRTGVMYRHESYANQDSEQTVGLDLGLHHMYKFSDYWKLVNDITYTPSFEDIHDYRIYHESAFEVPLARSDIWKLQLGVRNEYDSQPADDSERLDTYYFSQLVFEWE
jgi:putative salt-induced outer membrane protein YdiY